MDIQVCIVYRDGKYILFSNSMEVGTYTWLEGAIHAVQRELIRKGCR